MAYQDLVSRLLQSAPFASAEDAECALTTTLETLGYVLPARLVVALEAALPPECGGVLLLGRSASQSGSRTLPLTARGEGQQVLLPAVQLERIQVVCGVLGSVVPAELVQSMARELPSHLIGAFEPRVARLDLPPRRRGETTLAGGRPGHAHPLSEASPGSQHPMSTSQPAGAQQASLGAESSSCSTLACSLPAPSSAPTS